MADEWLQSLEEAMDGLWFHHNVLSDFIQRGLGTVTNATGRLPPSPSPPATASDDKPDEKHRHHGYRKKRPTRLNIITSDQLFQIPTSPLIRSSCRPSSLSPSTENNSPQSRKVSRRRPTRMLRSYKSCSELEQDELKGFMDLGFVFHEESLSQRMMSVIPGLQRLGKKATEQVKGEEDVTKKGRVRRPYLAEAWLINRPDSPLLNLKMLPSSSTEGADVKRQLRFWARTVASTIHQES